MNIKIIKKTAIITGSIIGFIYLLFLIAPFIVTPIVNGYVPKINEELQKTTGFTTEFEGFKVVTTPKLTVGVKVGKFVLFTPDSKKMMKADDFAVKMSLLPLLAKKIEIDSVFLNNLDLDLGVNKDGSFELEKYFESQDDVSGANPNKEDNEASELPFGLKLSNKLPDIKVNGYNVRFTDKSTGKFYDIKGNKTGISDFILNKSIRISSCGSIILAGKEQFKYDVKLYNKIMPDVELNDLIFNPKTEEAKPEEEFNVNVLNIFEGIYKNNITANVNGDMTFTPEGSSGYLKVDNMAVRPLGMELPPSNMLVKLNGNKINIDSHLYTAKDEVSTVTGVVRTGKNTNLDLNVKSNVELANVIKILNAIALTFDIKDLQTLTANGKLDANFNIKSDLKKVNSNGYIKIPAAKVNYGLYGVSVDNINADILLDNNNVNVKNIGFSILGQPLRLYGTISETAVANLHLTADNLGLKGLIVACGQAALLKENPVYSGLVSLKADIVGKLEDIKPTAKVTLSNVDLKNIPSDLRIKLPATNLNLYSGNKTFYGDASSVNVKLINPALTVSAPKVNAKINEDVIEITSTPVTAEKINFKVSGKIKNYLSEKILIDFLTTGDIKSTLKGDLNISKQTLNLSFSAPEKCTIIVPMFDKSKMIFSGGTNITGSMMNPHLSGSFNVESITLPEIPVQMKNIVAKLNGPILKGTATVENFASGGIAAENITTDFVLKGNDFYLNDLKGNAFDGKFNGNIIYNLATAKTKVDFKGSGMNAEKVIAGSAGIKNALSGTLEFDTIMDLIVYPDFEKMMRSIKGKMNFKIAKGTFGNIGRVEKFFHAPNIIKNGILKNTVNTLSNLTGIKSSAEFAFLSGYMTFSNGWANIDHIKSTGASISYFVTGKYNLVNGTANVVILGRLNNKIVKLLGPLGDLSAEKILSYIPLLGSSTKSTAESVTTDPDKEKTSEIPQLTETASGHKDFKVEYNGGLESTTSVKSFKWLSKTDTSELEQKSLSETIKSLKPSLKTDSQETKTGVKNIVQSIKTTQETIKTDTKNDLNELKNSVNDLKNLFKSSKTTAETRTEVTTENTEE